MLEVTGLGFDQKEVAPEVEYYKTFEIISTLQITNIESSSVITEEYKRFYKVALLTGTYNGDVVFQRPLSYTREHHGTYLLDREAGFPLFSEIDGYSSYSGEGNFEKDGRLGMVYDTHEHSRIDWLSYLEAKISRSDENDDTRTTLSSFRQARTMKLFTLFKPGLYGFIPIVDTLALECFNSTAIATVEVIGIA